MGDAPAPAVVETVDLSKAYGGGLWRRAVPALDGLSLSVPRGEVLGLVGPNGSGKTTTIKLLLGLLRPTRGTVRVFGRSPAEPAARARIGFLPEESYLPRFLSAREALDFYARLFRIPRARRRPLIESLLARVGLSAAADRPIREYSKGMARRVGLAQTLLNGPELVILDEPTSGLDPIGSREVKDLVIDLKRKGTTVIVASHLLADLESLCDRLVILDGGKVRRVGSAAAMLEREGRLLEVEGLADAALEDLRRFLSERGARLAAEGRPRRTLEALFLETLRPRGEGRPDGPPSGP